MRVLSKMEHSGDISHVMQCDDCKEVAYLTTVAVFVRRDSDSGQVPTSEYQRLHKHALACFKETHKCSMPMAI